MCFERRATCASRPWGQATGVDVETIRFYEKDGLLQAPARSDNDGLIDAQLSRVRARLDSMRALERQLIELRSRCQGAHVSGECGILQELVSAAHGEACACHPASGHD
jgi:MerR family regulatory protein